MQPVSQLLGHDFADPNLLKQALKHPSAAKRRHDRGYERLEFLGDRVLGLVVAEMLFKQFQNEPEGKLAKRHAALVCMETLAKVALALQLEHHIVAQSTGDTISQNVLADVVEALIAALYLDAGLPAVERFITQHWQPLLEADLAPPIDAKSALQEWAQGRAMARPEYSVLAQDGSDHAPTFTVQASLPGYAPQQAQGASKKLAEQAAAEVLLAHVTESDD